MNDEITIDPIELGHRITLRRMVGLPPFTLGSIIVSVESANVLTSRYFFPMMALASLIFTKEGDKFQVLKCRFGFLSEYAPEQGKFLSREALDSLILKTVLHYLDKSKT